jgi:hypothetical protein
MLLLPGAGLLQRLSKEYFCAQYMRKSPEIEKTTIIGYNEQKKQVKRKRLTIYMY